MRKEALQSALQWRKHDADAIKMEKTECSSMKAALGARKWFGLYMYVNG